MKHAEEAQHENVNINEKEKKKQLTPNYKYNI